MIMNMRILKFAVGAIAFVQLFTACNLENEVEIDLPDYAAQPVVECYLEPGKEPYMLLTQSADFFAPFDTSLNQFVQNIVLQNAVATVTYRGIVDTLKNNFYIDNESGKFYNYVGDIIIGYEPGTEYVLNIALPDGNTIMSKTIMPKVTVIDSVVIEWNQSDTMARALTYITDDLNATNYWRRVLNYGSLTDSIPNQDFLVRDNLNTTSKVAFGTGYDLEDGDTIYNTIFSITEAHLNYLESVLLAISGNQNPFASPSPIKSNVTGTSNPLGIFTPLVYDRVMTVVQK
jgi:hypothetical protein